MYVCMKMLYTICAPTRHQWGELPKVQFLTRSNRLAAVRDFIKSEIEIESDEY